MPAAGREHGVHVQDSPEVSRIRQSQRADRDVRLDRGSVVVIATDFADIAISSGQKQFSVVLADA